LIGDGLFQQVVSDFVEQRGLEIALVIGFQPGEERGQSCSSWNTPRERLNDFRGTGKIPAALFQVVWVVIVVSTCAGF